MQYLSKSFQQRRLNVLAETGLPVWVTELDIRGIDDKEELADNYEMVLRLFFSRPEIEGIMIWGFWDQQMLFPRAAMWEGDDILVSIVTYLNCHIVCTLPWHVTMLLVF